MWGMKGFSTVLLASSSPSSVRDLSNGFREFYQTLGEGAPVFQQATPTIRFSFVSPPSNEQQDWFDEDVLCSDASLMIQDSAPNNATSTLFERVSRKYGTKQPTNGNEEGASTARPIALYLPGLDGFGISAGTWQFNDLSKAFELWRMSIKVEDRSSFGELATTVSNFVWELAEDSGRPVYIIAESFGGLLAPTVALRLQKQAKREGKENPLHGLVLVNPATSFDESRWDILAPVLSSFGYLTDNIPMPFGLPSPYSVVGGLTLSALIPSAEQYQRILDTMLSIDSFREPSGAIDSLQGTLESFKITSEFLPPDLLEHRIKNWMIVGSSLIMSRLKQIEAPTLVVVGTEDNLIDSKNEVNRLVKTIPNCEKLEVRGSGHFVLDDKVNLTEAILYSKLDPFNFKTTVKAYDPILDWKLPPQEVVDQVYEESVKNLETAFSPVYISTNQEGTRSFGLDSLPREDGPVLFVANHQLVGLDLNLLISKFIDIDMPVRGLAHPIVFQGQGSSSRQRAELGGRTPGLTEKPKARGGQSTSNFEMFGAVMVTPRNYYRVLQTGQNALLFPGGVREVFHGRDEAYQLFWPEKVDFVRTAARFNATIVPLSAVGMADSFNMLLEPSEVGNLPFVGARAREFSANMTAARFDMANGEENFLPPILAPGLPSRNYFLFGKAVKTSDLDHKDEAACKAVYEGVKQEMERGFRDILEARKKDPYKEAAPRLAYERLSGNKAPTFDISEVNQIGSA